MIIQWIFLVLVLWTVPSRPTIFQEIKGQIQIELGNLKDFPSDSSTTTAPPPTTTINPSEKQTLTCYNCECIDDPNCACNETVAEPIGDTYCTIIRLYDGEDFWIIFEHIDRNSSGVYIRDFPYILVEESILYNDTTVQWTTRPTLVVYGCNTDYCNDPSLVPYLPISFQMRLPETWLNTNVLGTGQPQRDCHECPEAPQCGTTEFLDIGRCPIAACNTTCFVADTFDDPLTDLLCYQSYCLPEVLDEFDVNRHRVEIEGIIYGNLPDAQLELWEIDIYCRADDCSRPEIFQQLQQLLVVDLGDLSAFNITPIATTTPSPGEQTLTCYNCECIDDPNCACNETVAQPIGDTYCTIIRLYDGEDFWIIFEHIDRNSSGVYIRDFPYILVEESILYNDTTVQWTTRPTLVVYGCNTDYCNDPSLVPYLPISFQMRLPETWLNTNVLGTGQPQRDCHECPEAPQCGTTEFLDIGRCPIAACNTTCFVADTFDDPLTDLLCYQSYCLPEVLDEFDVNRHRVEIEGIIYGNLPNAQLELWEIDIYCRADDCSRPEIFQELQQLLIVDLGDLSAFNITPISTTTPSPGEQTITCYDCFCVNDPNCPCNTFSTANATLNYCTIIRQDYNDNSFFIALEHVNRNSSRVYIREFPFLLVEESILYDESTGRWSTRTNFVMYGCNTDYCNHPSFVPYLPNSFQMRMSEAWLNTNVLGTGQPQRDCHECPDAPQCGTLDFLDSSRCPIAACNTTCLVSDLYGNPDINEQCYQSYCAPPDSPFFTIDPHRVEMEGILYLNPIGRPVELWEIDIFCRADDCSRPTIFDEIRNQFSVAIGDLSIFYNLTTTAGTGSTTTTTAGTGSTTTTTAGTGSTTTTAVGTGSTTTTTPSAGASTYMVHIILILFSLAMSLLNLY